MRIALIGQAAFGEKVLNALADAGEELAVVYMPPDGGKPNSFREAAEALGIPVRQPARMRDPEVFEEYKTFGADLNVMAFVTDIVPMTILNHAPLGTIQYHPSLLPRHRGASAINWAVINGEPKTGLTIFWPDEGLDTGPILLQKEVTIEPDDTLGTVYFGKLFDLGVQAMLESVAAGQGRHGAEDRPGPHPRRVRAHLQAHGDRLDLSHQRGLQRHPRLQPVAGGGHQLQRPGVQGVRLRAPPGERSPGAGHRARSDGRRLPGTGLRRQHLRQAGPARGLGQDWPPPSSRRPPGSRPGTSWVESAP